MEKGKIDGDAVYYHDNGKVKAKGENKKDINIKTGSITIRQAFFSPKNTTETVKKTSMMIALPPHFTPPTGK